MGLHLYSTVVIADGLIASTLIENDLGVHFLSINSILSEYVSE